MLSYSSLSVGFPKWNLKVSLLSSCSGRATWAVVLELRLRSEGGGYSLYLFIRELGYGLGLSLWHAVLDHGVIQLDLGLELYPTSGRASDGVTSVGFVLAIEELDYLGL